MGALPPITFFDIEFDVREELTKLPDTSALLAEKKQLSLKMRWTEKGLICQFTAKKLFTEEDVLELYIDTRAVKDAKSLHPYCHHIAVGLEGAEEITEFRGDDARELTGPFRVIHGGKKLEIHLEGLYGFDPTSTKRFGFNYSFYSGDGQKEHFSLSSQHYDLIKHPHLWATGHMIC